MVQPFRTLVLLLTVGAILLVLMWVLPAELSFWGFNLRLPRLASLWPTQQPLYVQARIDRLDSLALVQEKGDTIQLIQEDSSAAANNPAQDGTVHHRICYPTGQDTLLYAFFRQMDALKDGIRHKTIHILHFGDSQLEGDRISADLRHRLQEIFGGCGPGLQGATSRMNEKISVEHSWVRQWQWYPLFGKYAKQAPSNYFSILGNLQLIELGSAPSITPTEEDFLTVITFRSSSRADRKDQSVEQLRLLLRKTEGWLIVRILQEGKEIATQRYEASPTVQQMLCQLEQPFGQVAIQLAGQGVVELHGVSLECRQGVVVDNIPIRGSAGLEFSRIPAEHLQQQLSLLDVGLLIFQFGVNVGEAEDYSYYEEGFYHQLQYFRRLVPDIPILVVSTSDRSKKSDVGYVSLENIEKLRDAQRSAAFRAGCAFWDLFEAMGGINSMPAWVMAKPALANKDFTHFTLRGAHVVANMLYQALMYEYQLYKKQLHAHTKKRL